MADNLTRWSVALLGGALAFCGIVGSFTMATADERAQNFHQAITAFDDDERLDAKLELDTYDIKAFGRYGQMAQDSELDYENSCQGADNVAHVCQVDINGVNVLDLTGASAEFYPSGHAVITGVYKSDYDDLIDGASTVTADATFGKQVVTREGHDRYTLTRVQHSAAVESGWWAQVMRTTPAQAVWIAGLAVGGIVTVLITLLTRPTTQRVEVEGVEFFDGKL